MAMKFRSVLYSDSKQLTLRMHVSGGELNSVTLPPDLSQQVTCRYCHSSLCSCRKIKVEEFDFTFIRMHNLHKCLIKKDFVLFGL